MWTKVVEGAYLGLINAFVTKVGAYNITTFGEGQMWSRRPRQLGGGIDPVDHARYPSAVYGQFGISMGWPSTEQQRQTEQEHSTVSGQQSKENSAQE